jgi:multiple sugar transport system ATP-binding protein
MNFLDATLVKQDSKLFVDGGSFRLEMPAARQAQLAGYAGKPIKFGIRPEDIHDRQFAPVGINPAHTIAKVDLTELMGNELIVNRLLGNKTVVGRVDPRTQARPGQDLDISLNLDNMHIFDPQTEKALV